MKDFKNLLELFDHFKDDQTCRDYLEQERWGGNPVCPFCGHDQSYKIEGGKRYKCANKECHKKYSVTVGTIYENSKISLRLWFAAIYLCTSRKKGTSSCQLARDLNIEQKTAWFVLHRVREMLREKAPVMLKEEVQFDETYYGGKEKNKHANKKNPKSRARNVVVKTPIIGVVETGGKVAVTVTQFVAKSDVKKIVNKYVEDGTTMVTDGFAMYAFLGKDNRFTHVVVDHQKGEYVRDGFHTNGIENFWSHLKRGLDGIYHQVSPQHLQRYCDEYAARYNTRDISDIERFTLSIQNSEGRLKYKDLIS